jgi:hypothetical protein
VGRRDTLSGSAGNLVLTRKQLRMPPPDKSPKRPQVFLSDSSGPSGDELPPPAILLSSSSSKTIKPPSASSDAAPSGPATSVARSARAVAKSPAAASKKGAGKKASSSSTADEQVTHPSDGHHPMATRSRDASRAGRLRGVTGLG